MKKIIIILVLLTLGFLLLRATDYDKRMEIYNAQNCAVYGYQSDCETKLK